MGEEILILKYINGINAVCEIDLVMYLLKLHFVFQSQSILCNTYYFTCSTLRTLSWCVRMKGLANEQIKFIFAPRHQKSAVCK